MKSLKTKMVCILFMLVLVICLGLGALSFVLGSVAQKDSYERDLEYIAQETAEYIDSEVEGKLSTLTAIANRADIKSTKVKSAKKSRFFNC